MTDKIEKIKERLEKAEISFEEIIPDDPEFRSRMIFEIPAQREKHECILTYRDEIVEQAFECNFENYRFVRSYESIWSKRNKTIEAEVGNVEREGYTGVGLYTSVELKLKVFCKFD